MEKNSSMPERGSAFPPTQWTIIVTAVSGNPERAREAYQSLCSAYRQPIVSWFRRKDFYQDPEDLAHSFVAYLIEKSLLSKVTPRTGKFRCFLVVTMHNFLRDSWDKLGSGKRGGGIEKVSLQENDVEIEANTDSDSQLDVDFALTIHRRVMAQLSPRPELGTYIFQTDAGEGWDAIATRLGKSSAALRKEVSRLRRDHWQAFRDEVAEIVTPAGRAEETQYLYEVLFRNLPGE